MKPDRQDSNGKGASGSSAKPGEERDDQQASKPNDPNGNGLSSGSKKPSQDGDALSPSGRGTPGATNGEASSESPDGTTGGQEGASQKALDQANMDYAREATDMVLDYLDRTREAPDAKLLEELQWDEGQLKRFQERWQSMRQESQKPGSSENFEEALRSLGMRDPKLPQAPITGSSAGDNLGGVRDDGGRRRVPAAYRDAFEAFQRSLVQ